MSQLIPSPETAFRKKYRNLAQALVEAITADIENGVLKPGEKLPSESLIMAKHEVSRTVVREAISHLQATGWCRRGTASAPSCWRGRQASSLGASTVCDDQRRARRARTAHQPRDRSRLAGRQPPQPESSCRELRSGAGRDAAQRGARRLNRSRPMYASTS
jgi:DNA-binding transcriptional MocR family regulator